MRIFKLFVLVSVIAIFQACGSSSGKNNNDTTIISGFDAEKSDLNTLSVNTQDIQKILMDGVWKHIDINIASFYANNHLPSYQKEYKINMVFREHKVVAYADCQKITANYKIKDKTITFSNSIIAPAIDLPSCEQVEYADDGVLAFLSNELEVKEAHTKKILFVASDFDTEVSISK